MNRSAVFPSPSPSCPAETALSLSLSVVILISCFYFGNVVKLSCQQQLPVPGSDLKPTKTHHRPLAVAAAHVPLRTGHGELLPRTTEEESEQSARRLSGRASKQHTGVSDETVADTEAKRGRKRE